MSHHIIEYHKQFYQNTSAATPEGIEMAITKTVNFWNWRGDKAIASNRDSRPRTINTLLRIYRQALTLGYAPDPIKLREIGLNLRLLDLRLDGFREDPQAQNQDHYFEPMSSHHLDTHPIALIPADDSPSENQAIPLEAPFQPSDYVENIRSVAGATASDIKWHFMEAPRENYCEALRSGTEDPYAHFELTEETGWYSSDARPLQDNPFGLNFFSRHPIAAIPRRYGDGLGWFVDTSFVCPPTNPDESHPHLSLIVCHDYEPRLHDETNNIHSTLLHGEIKAIMHAMIARYNSCDWPALLEHQVIPIQVVSVIGDRARILQAHFNGQELVVRKSLLITPREPGIAGEDEWYELFARYLAAKPIGNTRSFPLTPSGPFSPPPRAPRRWVSSRKERAPRHSRPRPSHRGKKHRYRGRNAVKPPTTRPAQPPTPSTSTRFDTVVGENVPPGKRKRDDDNNNNGNGTHRIKRRAHPARDCW
ncbi:hypothetical protein BJY00DRAFT_314276 [Aspergillus carlsbadensis]|nr:hypothetical protein BJY00DRAFT_314276 [Aspergillus carlsbadensis]